VYVSGSRSQEVATPLGYQCVGSAFVTYVGEKITMVSFRRPGYLL
jgi:hypothetical protein